jgi:hypothetical protein
MPLFAIDYLDVDNFTNNYINILIVINQILNVPTSPAFNKEPINHKKIISYSIFAVYKYLVPQLDNIFILVA